MLNLVAALAWSVWLADIGPNETQVLLALIGTVASVANTLLLGRARQERKKSQQQVREAIDRGGLVAMVPEKVVNEIAGPTPPAPAPHDQAP